MKAYQVNTVQDMINCTNSDNLDNFLIDLKALLKSAHALQDYVNSVSDSEGISKELAKLESNGFEWIDDGEHNITINLESKPL
jgi:hypothetical protein